MMELVDHERLARRVEALRRLHGRGRRGDHHARVVQVRVRLLPAIERRAPLALRTLRPPAGQLENASRSEREPLQGQRRLVDDLFRRRDPKRRKRVEVDDRRAHERLTGPRRRVDDPASHLERAVNERALVVAQLEAGPQRKIVVRALARVDQVERHAVLREQALHVRNEPRGEHPALIHEADPTVPAVRSAGRKGVLCEVREVVPEQLDQVRGRLSELGQAVRHHDLRVH